MPVSWNRLGSFLPLVSILVILLAFFSAAASVPVLGSVNGSDGTFLQIGLVLNVFLIAGSAYVVWTELSTGPVSRYDDVAQWPPSWL